MNADLITLSAEHSARLHALRHIAGFMSMDELIDELIFSYDPNNTLQTISDGLVGAPKRRIDSMFSDRRHNDFEGWEDLVSKASVTPPYDPLDYPEPKNDPTNIIQFEVIK